MASNTCTELVIHPNYKPYHLSATHSNISFGIALRNIANKRSSFHEQFVSDNSSYLSEEQTHMVQPLNVALPSVSSEATFDPQASHEHSTEPDYMITSDFDVEDEHDVQANLSLDSSSPFVLESVHDQSSVQSNLNTDIPSSSHQIIPQIITTHVSPHLPFY